MSGRTPEGLPSALALGLGRVDYTIEDAPFSEGVYLPLSINADGSLAASPPDRLVDTSSPVDPVGDWDFIQSWGNASLPLGAVGLELKSDVVTVPRWASGLCFMIVSGNLNPVGGIETRFYSGSIAAVAGFLMVEFAGSDQLTAQTLVQFHAGSTPAPKPEKDGPMWMSNLSLTGRYSFKFTMVGELQGGTFRSFGVRARFLS